MAAYNGDLITETLATTTTDWTTDEMKELVTTVKSLVTEVNKLTTRAEAEWTS